MLLLRFLLPFLGATATALAQVSDADFAAIRREGFDRSQVMDHLDHLCNRIGPRLTGSDNLTVAGEWARDTFTAMGLANVQMEAWGEFAVGFNRGPWWGRMTKPEALEFVCNTDAWTAGTKRPSRGPVLPAPKNADELASLTGRLQGAWLLDPPASGEFFKTLSAAVEAAGGFGFVGGGRGELLLTGGSPRIDWNNLPKLPFVRLRSDQHQKLRALVTEGVAVEVEFDLRNHFRKGPIPLYNVIADLPGTEHPDEYVVVGGHLDSWDGATGATDNGTGAATTLEAARILTAIGAKPKRTIRFMLWSGEEQGLLGSRAWVQKHKDEMAKYSACLVHDGGTNYLSGIAGMKEMRPQLELVFAPVLRLDEAMPFKIRDIEAFRPIGSDHESFTAAGVPGFFWDQAGRANYTRTHHTQYDTYDAAIPEYQKHSSVVIAVGALGLANLPELLSRENMKVQRGFSGGAGGGRQGRGTGRLLGVQLADDGLTIAEVGDGLAQKAGLKAGDRIVRIGEGKVAAREDLRRLLDEGTPQEAITVLRGGGEVTVQVTFER